MNGPIAQPLSLAMAEWRLKVRLSAGLVPFFCVPYFLLQRLPVAPVWRPSPGRLEEAVGFQPEWVWAYQSAYVLLAFVPWLAASGARDLQRYARGFVLLSSIGFICFVLFPIECPRPPDAPSRGMYGLLVTYDRPLNTFPSLHVGLSVYTVLFGARVLRGRMAPRRRRALLVLLGLWICAIAWAAVAIRQHFVVDLPAGAALAWVCHRWAWRLGAQTGDPRERASKPGRLIGSGADPYLHDPFTREFRRRRVIHADAKSCAGAGGRGRAGPRRRGPESAGAFDASGTSGARSHPRTAGGLRARGEREPPRRARTAAAPGVHRRDDDRA